MNDKLILTLVAAVARNGVIGRANDLPWDIPEGVRIYRSLEEALEKLRDQPEVCVIGGGEIYRQTMPLADRLEVTHVDQEVRGDVTFPTIDPKVWKKTFEEKHERYTFATYEKIRV